MNNDTIVLMVVLFIITLIILLPVLLEYKKIDKQCYDLRMKLLSKHDDSTWTDIWKVETSPSSPTIDKFLMDRLETLEKELNELRQELEKIKNGHE